MARSFWSKCERIAGEIGQEQRAARRLTVARPGFGQIVSALEKARGESWAQFHARHGDSGRDLALPLGRQVCRLKPKELASLAGMNDYTSVAQAIKRFGQRLENSAALRLELKNVCQLSNVKM